MDIFFLSLDYMYSSHSNVCTIPSLASGILTYILPSFPIKELVSPLSFGVNNMPCVWFTFAGIYNKKTLNLPYQLTLLHTIVYQ